MEFQDKSLRCVDCGNEFIWTAGEQLFFADKQFKNEPKRCKSCKAKRASRTLSSPSGGRGEGYGRERVETQATCSACGKETTVPFRPTQGRPIFCKECFQQRKFAGASGGVSRRELRRSRPSDRRSSSPDAGAKRNAWPPFSFVPARPCLRVRPIQAKLPPLVSKPGDARTSCPRARILGFPTHPIDSEDLCRSRNEPQAMSSSWTSRAR